MDTSQPSQPPEQENSLLVDQKKNADIENFDPTTLNTLQPAQAAQQQRPDFWNNPRPTNENPNFVQDYFASSRLHFIGSFRARYESMMVQVGKRLGINPSVLLNDNSSTKKINRNSPAPSVIVHVDMDAFFASVAVRDNPSLKGQPVAVCHDAGEISSCTYEAREFGIRAGMFLREARKLCPSLQSVSYDFNAYEQVSIQIYTLFYQIPKVRVEAVSVDEAYLDMTATVSTSNSQNNDGDSQLNTPQTQQNVEELIRSLRDRILERTGCTASAGIGPSKLMARLATKRAKPNGQFYVLSDEVISYIDSLKLSDLPGIGYRTLKRMTAQLKIETIQQLRSMPVDRLQHLFGDRQGETFYQLVRGIDKRQVETLKPRRSIGAELSWGIRFLSTEEHKVYIFISQVAAQVALRVTTAGANGTRVTYKVYKRIHGADASHYKHLGHGPCTILTKSSRLPSSRLAGPQLKKALIQLCHELHKQLGVAHEDFRGIGIQVVDLVFADLKLDHFASGSSSAPFVPTKRIESFFKSAGRSGSTVSPDRAMGITHSLQRTESINRDESDDINAVYKNVPRRHTENGINGTPSNPISNEIEAVGRQRGNDDEIDSIKQSSSAGNKRQLNDHDNGQINESDRVEVKESRSIDVTVEEGNGDYDASRNSIRKDIPSGWDRSVFENLPLDIQTELLKQSKNDTERIARRHNGQSQQLTLGQMFNYHAQAPRRSHHINSAISGDRDGDRATSHTKRRKRGGQVTITQLVEVGEARRKGNQMVSASEFRGHGLRNAVELLEDLKGQSSRFGLSKDSVGDQYSQELRKPQTQDIPSPPSLSSDDEDIGLHGSENDDEKLRLHRIITHRRFENSDKTYAEEDVTKYAHHLVQWMKDTGPAVKSAHVELLRGRLLEMLRLGSLQRLCEELRILRRFVICDDIVGWIRPFNTLLSQLQQECRNDYAFALNVQNIPA